MTRTTQLTAFLAGMMLSAVSVAADEKPSSKPAATAEVKTLVEQLRSGKYKERNEATKKLMAVGGAAVGPVAQAARTDDLELGARCVDVLKHYLHNGDAAAQAAARKALSELQSSKHASVAKWAGEALQRGRLGANPNFGRNRIINRAGRIGRVGGPLGFQREVQTVENGKTIHIKETILPGNRSIVVKVTEKVNGKDKTTEYKATTAADLLRKNKPIYDLYIKHIPKARLQIIGPNNAAIPVQVGGGGLNAPQGAVRISSSTVNGRRTLTITEAGRQTVIQDQNGKDITITITETVNGKQKQTQVKAKDLADLKQKNAEAAKTYERYGNFGPNRFGAVIGGAFGGPGGGVLPVRRAIPAVPLQGAPGNQRIDSRKEIEKAKSRLQTSIDKLQKLAASGKANARELRDVADEIKAARQDLERATRNLEP